MGCLLTLTILRFIPKLLGDDAKFGMRIGKPVGIVVASVLAVRLGVATKPEEYSWRQLAGAGALAGIGFTMSLFIATQALTDTSDFAAAKIAVFAGSILSASVAVIILWNADRRAQPAVAVPKRSCAASVAYREAKAGLVGKRNAEAMV